MQTHIIVSAAYLCTHLSKRSSLGLSIYGQLELPQVCTINNFSKVKHNLEKVDAVLSTQGLNQFGVHWFIHTVGQDAQVSLTSATHTKKTY